MPAPDGSPAGRIRAAGVELLTAIEAAARRAAQQWDTTSQGTAAGHPWTTPQENAHTVRVLADHVAAAILASAPEASRNEPRRPHTATAAAVPTPPSRNEPAPAAAPRKSAPAPAPSRPGKTSRDNPKPGTEPTPTAKGIEPRPQKLARKKAASIVDAAELVRHPDYRDNHRWILRSGDTVLGSVEPTYGGASQSGRNGWTGPRCKSRDGVAADLATRWVRLVTATPKRRITGDSGWW